jgi:hypothetical protein
MSRDKFHISYLELFGVQGQLVKNTFIQQKESSAKLALIYPGLRYSCDRPLLYYTTELLLNRSFDVMQLWTNYSTSEFKELSQTEQTIQLIEDGKVLLQSALHARTYTQLVMTGKSLGTLTMAFILREELNLPSMNTIWLTPLFHLPPVAQAVLDLSSPAFVAGSKSDPTFDSETVSKLQSLPLTTTHIIEQADHSLEIPGDPLRSLQVLTQLVDALAGFLT